MMSFRTRWVIIRALKGTISIQLMALQDQKGDSQVFERDITSLYMTALKVQEGDFQVFERDINSLYLTALKDQEGFRFLKRA